MSDLDSQAKFDRAMGEDKRVGFDRWMTSAQTKILISLLPPGEHTEGVLLAAYESGFNSGMVAATASLAKAIFSGPRR